MALEENLIESSHEADSWMMRFAKCFCVGGKDITWADIRIAFCLILFTLLLIVIGIVSAVFAVLGGICIATQNYDMCEGKINAIFGVSFGVCIACSLFFGLCYTATRSHESPSSEPV